MLAIVCPGQGSQTPGFLAPWLELPSVAGQLASLSDIAGIDLIARGTTSDEETIKDTAVAQPLIVAAGLVETLGTYLELGHSLEATARELFVHANTVRYRLKRVCDVTGWDPLLPREAFVLQAALVVGRLSAPPKAATERQASRNQA